MPVRKIQDQGETAGTAHIDTRLIGLGPLGQSDYDAARTASSANVRSSGAKSAIVFGVRKFPIGAGNFKIERGVSILDFSKIVPVFPKGIKIIKLKIDISENRTFTHGDTNGDKIRVGHLSNPVSLGSYSAGDFDITRHDLTSFSDALTIVDDTNNQIFDISNKKLLNALENAINNRSFIHLSFLNELDFSGTEPTGNNFLDVSTLGKAGATSMSLRVFYRTNSRRFQQGRGAFAGTDIRNSAGKGFGTF
jgi:hypothetical protein